MSQAGFSLVEMLVVCVVLVGVASIGFWNLGRRPMASHGKALAEVLASAVEAARERAMSQGVPVALVFPSGDGIKGHAQAFYLLEGETKPRVVRITNFTGDHPKTVVFNGVWGNATLTPPRHGSAADTFDIDAWQMPNPHDYAFIFLPSGALVTNGLPLSDGAYHVVTSYGIEAGSVGSPPGSPQVSTRPTYFAASKVAHPYTVSITAAGQVSVKTGLPNGGEATESEEFLGFSQPPAPPPITDAPEASPTFERVVLRPDPTKQDLPPGVDVLVARDGRLSLTVEARSPEGATLFCTWTATAGTVISTSEYGKFASQGRTRCIYDEDSGLWRSNWEWVPPPNVGKGDQYSLRCKVEDAWGNEAPATTETQIDIQLGIISPKIFFVSNRRNKDEIYLTADDGSGTRRVSNHAQNVAGVTPSPDGSHIAYELGGKLYISNSDGTAARSIEGLRGQDPAWLANGTKLAFVNNTSLYVVNADGSGLTELTPDHEQIVRYPSWSEDGSQIAFTSIDPLATGKAIGRNTSISVSQGGGPSFNPAVVYDRETPKGNIWVINSDGSELEQITRDNSRDDVFPNFSPSGDHIIFSRQDDGETGPGDAPATIVMNPGKYNLYKVKADGTGSRKLRGPSPNPYEGFWSPSGDKIAFTEGDAVTSRIYTISSTGGELTEISAGLPGLSTKPIWLVGDTNRLVFQNGTGAEQDIFIVQSDGNELKRLTEEPGMDIPVGTSW